MYDEVCTGCGLVKECVTYELGIRVFCSKCSKFMDKMHILALRDLNKIYAYSPPKGVYQ